MRIGIGQLWQETNTFNPLATTRRNFKEFGVYHGPELVREMADTNEPGGFIQTLRSWPEQPDIVGLVRLAAWPSGRVSRDTFEWLFSEMMSAIRGAGRLDGVLLALHGAMVADEHMDVEGEMLEAVRREIGSTCPLVATLDLHANITERMVRNADALVVFHTAPHIDVYETGCRAAGVLRRLIVERLKTVKYFQKLPLVLPAEKANTQDPASASYRFRRRLEDLESQPNILSAGLATVQPWLDVPELGAAVVITAATEDVAAQQACGDLAEEVWKHRSEFLPELTPVAEAVKAAHAHGKGLVVLSDAADATTSGAPGDSTWVLAELLKYRWPRGALVTLVSPEGVAAMTRAGAGARLTLPLGGYRDRRNSRPLELDLVVDRLFEARFTLSGHLARNLPIDMGPSAVARVRDVQIVVTSRSGPHFAPDLFQAAGIDPFAANVLVAKSPCGFRAAYADQAERIILVQAPGCAPSDFWRYEYQRIPHPLWPWNETTKFAAAPRKF